MVRVTAKAIIMIVMDTVIAITGITVTIAGMGTITSIEMCTAMTVAGDTAGNNIPSRLALGEINR